VHESNDSAARELGHQAGTACTGAAVERAVSFAHGAFDQHFAAALFGRRSYEAVLPIEAPCETGVDRSQTVETEPLAHTFGSLILPVLATRLRKLMV
jgi:hypothetical protein